MARSSMNAMQPATFNSMPRRVVIGLVVAFLCLKCTATAEPPAAATRVALATPKPLDVEAARESFRLPAELTIELVACEPEIVDPVAIRFDERGGMWVVQMVDYPYGPAAGEQPASRISRLEDRDGDGRYETATSFRDHLLFPTGIQPWRDGIIVTLAGRVVWMQDSDKDGKCDKEEVWFEGFAEGNSQLRANHPTLALDNTIYIANGLRGGEIRDVRRPESPLVSIRNRDFRFDPLGPSYEPVSGLSQFGLTFDDFGRRFLCSNRNPCRHVVIEDRYMARNPRLLLADTVHDVAPYAENSRLHPLTRAWTTSNLHAHQFTAACGVLWFRGSGLGPQYSGNIFVCDPTGNLVHREIAEPLGVTFRSRPAYDDREFLASTDEWFRPVNLEVGPDGALYVVDMYRAVIEHPEFMPDELKNRPDLLLGRDRGRIWRVRARTAPVQYTPVGTTPSEWLAALKHANSWQRETAARLILENQPAELVRPLEHLAQNAPTPVTRSHALWLLRGLGALPEPLLLAALADPDAAVREQALILSEQFRDQPMWRRRVRAMAEDADARVRFHVALWLAPISNTDEVNALADILRRGADDVWTRRAVLLAAGAYSGHLLQFFLDNPHRIPVADEMYGLILSELADATGRSVTASPELFGSLLQATLNGEDRRGLAAQIALARLLASGAATSQTWRTFLADSTKRQEWERLLRKARQTALDVNLPTGRRQTAVELLRFGADSSALQELCLRPSDDTSLRVLAIRYASSTSDANFWQQLIQRFRQEVPAVRTALIDAAIAQTTVAELLAKSLDEGLLRPQDIPPADFARLERHPDMSLRSRFAAMAALRTPKERQEAVKRFEPALQLPADPQRGRTVFAKNCASCHRIGDLGVDVAPDISDSRTKLPQQLLIDILQPNRAIDANYISYVVQTSDGRVITGIVAGETATSITLRQAENKTETLPKSEIESIQSTGLSLMPEGLEENLSLQDMADLISFIKNWRYLNNGSIAAPSQ